MTRKSPNLSPMKVSFRPSQSRLLICPALPSSWSRSSTQEGGGGRSSSLIVRRQTKISTRPLRSILGPLFDSTRTKVGTGSSKRRGWENPWAASDNPNSRHTHAQATSRDHTNDIFLSAIPRLAAVKCKVQSSQALRRLTGDFERPLVLPSSLV